MSFWALLASNQYPERGKSSPGTIFFFPTIQRPLPWVSCAGGVRGGVERGDDLGLHAPAAGGGLRPKLDLPGLHHWRCHQRQQFGLRLWRIATENPCREIEGEGELASSFTTKPPQRVKMAPVNAEIGEGEGPGCRNHVHQLSITPFKWSQAIGQSVGVQIFHDWKWVLVCEREEVREQESMPKISQKINTAGFNP